MKDYKSKEDKIFDIINRLKQVELEEGNGEEWTKYLYTHGSCYNLASLIKSQFLQDDSVKVMHMFLNKEYVEHMAVVVTDCKDEDEFSKSNSSFYDINGKTPISQAPQYLYSFENKIPKETDPEMELTFVPFVPYYKESLRTTRVYEQLQNENLSITEDIQDLTE